MPKKAGAILAQFFTYDFSGNAGANGLVGSYNTGIQLPLLANIIRVNFFSTIPTVGGSVSLGTVATPILLTPVQAAGSIAYLSFLSPPQLMDYTLNIILDITVADITAGVVGGVIEYYIS